MEKVESGLQLFKRTKIESNSQELPKLFEDGGPSLGDFIEIVGESNSGKTYLLSYYIIKYALPKFYKDVNLGGFECKVVLINCDMKFNIIDFVSLLETYIKTHVSSAKKYVSQIVQECLANITIIDCFNHDQYIITLHNLERLLKYDQTTLVCIDSICPYYWTEKKTLWSFVSYYNEITEVLKEAVKFRNVLVMFTRDINFVIQQESVKCKSAYCFNIKKNEKNMFAVSVNKGVENVNEFLMEVNFTMHNVSK